MSISVIHVLDENTANKIAAGEVVQRPASVIKELVENSIDARSRNIEIEIADGGIGFMRVTDDGAGMSAADAKLAILRHATSKITSAEDLSSISSLGFRGEALPSIAAVSKFSITTRLHNEPLAAYVEVQGGIITDIREAGANPGTTVTVAELFFNTPARRKFLKTPGSESSHIHAILEKLAISHPEISFRLLNNGKLTLSTPGKDSLADTLAALYGYKITPDILPLGYLEDNISVSGYIGKPTLLKSSRQWQTFIVDSRIINSRMIAKALDNAYHSLLPKSGYPLAVIHIVIPADSIDVNVHPQKSEIKFSDEQKIYRAVYKAILSVLTAQNEPGKLAATVSPQPSLNNYETKYSGNSVYPANNYQQSKDLWSEHSLPLSATREVMKQEERPFTLQNIGNEKDNEDKDNAENRFVLRPLGQIDDCYIVAQGIDGLYIIDQHAAHERILYDKMSLAVGRVPVQQLLLPLFLDFDLEEMNILMERQSLLYELGFALETMGPNTMRLLELPLDIDEAETESTLRQIMILIRTMHKPEPQDIRHAYLQTAACRRAVKAGEVLNMRQIQALMSELCATALPFTCPHGRPAIIRFSPGDLAKMFKRT